MKSTSRYIFLLLIAIILFSSILIITNHIGYAQRLLNPTFFLFVIGVVLYIWESIYKHED